ncbi:glycosyltransferase family 2 protein, partial [Seonamhaeicola marinus]
MKIAVVILNWNGKQLLEQFLPSVTKHTPEATIYVADNASTDASVAFVKAHYPNIKIIQNPE